MAAGTADAGAFAVLEKDNKKKAVKAANNKRGQDRKNNEKEALAKAKVAAANGDTEAAALVTTLEEEAKKKRTSHKSAVDKVRRDNKRKKLNEAKEKLPWAREILKARAEGNSEGKDVAEHDIDGKTGKVSTSCAALPRCAIPY